MTYLLYGIEEYLINKEIEKISTNNKIETINIVNYEYSDNIKNIIDDANTYSMFQSNKMIVVNDFIFTTDDKEIDIIGDYLKNPNPNTILIFVSSTQKLDERKKITKLFKSYAKVEEFIKVTNPINIVKEMFHGYEIGYSDMVYFIDRVGDNIEMLEMEADKLKNYKFDEKKISREDIDNITTNNVDLDIFNLVEKITLKDKKESLEIYYAMLKNGEEPLKILILLANQFRIIYQAKNLYLKGYSEADIASTLKIHPYRIKLALEKGRTLNNDNLLKYLKELANLDYQIKSNQIDKTLGLELFIVNM
jgi:DNA polymerase-3 subunit delta